MFRSRLHTRLVGATALVLAAACASDDATGPSATQVQMMSADLALNTGQSVASDVAVWRSNEGAVGGGFGGAGAPPGGSCTTSGNTVTCTGGREGAFTVTRSFSFFDASGAAMGAYDSLLTGRIDFATTISGSFSGTTPRGETVTGSENRSRAMSVSGLAGQETQRTWNGTGSGTHEATITGDRGTRRYRATGSDTTTNVVWVVAPTRGAYPASGTTVRRVTQTQTLEGDQTVSRTITRRVQVTFNGTAQVPMQVSLDGPRGTVERSCTLDLAARTVSCN